jgi:Stage II sporulation protein M
VFGRGKTGQSGLISPRTTTSTREPVFTYSMMLRLSSLFALAGMGFLLGVASLFMAPVSVPVFIFWSGLGAMVAYPGVRLWRTGVKGMAFYDDRIQLIGRGFRRDVPYSDVERLWSFMGRVNLVFKDHSIPTLSVTDGKVDKATKRRDWLATRVMSGAVAGSADPLSVGFVKVIRDDVENLLGQGAKWVLLLLATEMVAMIAVSSIPFLSGEQSYYTLLNQQQNAAFSRLSDFGQFVEIFVNNIKDALANLIPGIGSVVFAIATYNTARIIQVDALAAQFSPALYSVALFLYPHSLIELSGYAIAVFEAFQISRVWNDNVGRPGFSRFIIKHFIGSACIVTLVILVAAIFEESEIAYRPYALLAWIPFGLIVFGIFSLRRRLNIASGRNWAGEGPVDKKDA